FSHAGEARCIARGSACRPQWRAQSTQRDIHVKVCLLNLMITPGEESGNEQHCGNNEADSPNNELTMAGCPLGCALCGLGKFIFFQLTTGINWHGNLFGGVSSNGTLSLARKLTIRQSKAQCNRTVFASLPTKEARSESNFLDTL